MTYTAADIIRMIRATNDGEFALSFQEAELTLKLFASVQVETAKLRDARPTAVILDFEGAPV